MSYKFRSYKFLVTAEPFAFGPASKAISIAGALVEAGAEVSLVGSGSTRSFFGLNAESMESTTVISSTELSISELQQFDMVVSVMDPGVAIKAASCKIPVAYIDSLHWMWPHDHHRTKELLQLSKQISCGKLDNLDSLPKQEQIYVAYKIAAVTFLQGIEFSARRISDVLDANVVSVGAIVNNSSVVRNEKRGRPLLSLGGSVTPINSVEMAEKYADVVSKIMTPSLFHRNPFVHGHEVVSRRLALHGWDASAVSKSVMEQHIANASFMFANAGLTTTIEAAVARTPIAYLPESIRSNRPNFEVFGGDTSVFPHLFLTEQSPQALLSDHQALAQLTDALQHDTNALKSLKDRCREIIERFTDPIESKAISNAQYETVNAVMGGFDGIDDVLRTIEKMLHDIQNSVV